MFDSIRAKTAEVKKTLMAKAHREQMNALGRLVATNDGKVFMAYLKSLEAMDNVNLRMTTKEKLEGYQGKAERLQQIILALTELERMKEK